MPETDSLLAPIIEVDGLVKRYGDRLAVDRISFDARQGEVFGLLGPNGAGKTTTLNVLCTLLQPDAGQVRIAGFDIHRQADQAKAAIGYVPQELSLFPSLSARDNLAFFGRIYRMDEADLRARIPEVLDLVGLAERANDRVKTFSGGMKRRLNIAIGLVHRPKVLLMDEPTVGVDPQSRNFIFEHVELLKGQGMAVIYTTHYMEEAERLCDRVAIMDEGRILALDSTANLLNLLGGGLIYVAFDRPPAELLPALETLPFVHSASAENPPAQVPSPSGSLPSQLRAKLETQDANRALLALIELCLAQQVRITSLQVMEPNLESVFLHLTSKRLRD